VTPQNKRTPNNEWYTPSRYTEAARAVMGGIDLDPASCEMANQTVKASRYYAKEQNGLMQPWHGHIWLNCPFSEQAAWSKKLLQEYREGNIEQAIFLAQAATERVWFQALWLYPLCFADHQVVFDRPGAPPYHIYHGVCFVYLGPNESKFIEVFSKFGRIAKAIDTPPVKLVTRELWEEAQ
jgi:ParB family chromosome partitioning protein